MMKITLCKTALLGPISGADEIMLNYALHLHRVGCSVKVVLLYAPSEEDQYLRRLRESGIPTAIIVRKSILFATLRALRHLFSSVFFFLFVLRHASDGLRRIWQIALELISRLHYRECRSYFKNDRPDVLHVFTPDTGAVLMIRAGHDLGIPVLYHEMGTAHHMPMLTAHYSHLERFLPLCTEVAALSPRLASEWQNRFPFLPSVSVLPLIMDQVKMLDLGVQSEANDDQTVFGFAARLEEGKGPLTLLEAVAKVNREAPVAVVRIAGIGPQLLDIKARARELDLGDACELVGHYTEPLGKTAFMESLDVFVLPSLAEGTPNSVIEAMAHGVPIIATEVGGIPDIIGGDAGILVPPGDVNSLAEAMLFLAGNSDLRKNMGVAAKQRYERFFSPRVVLPLILETYERVTRNGNHSMSCALGNGNRHPWAPE